MNNNYNYNLILFRSLLIKFNNDIIDFILKWIPKEYIHEEFDEYNDFVPTIENRGKTITISPQNNNYYNLVKKYHVKININKCYFCNKYSNKFNILPFFYPDGFFPYDDKIDIYSKYTIYVCDLCAKKKCKDCNCGRKNIIYKCKEGNIKNLIYIYDEYFYCGVGYKYRCYNEHVEGMKSLLRVNGSPTDTEFVDIFDKNDLLYYCDNSNNNN